MWTPPGQQHGIQLSAPVGLNPDGYGNTETFTVSVGFPSGTPLEIAQESHGIPLRGNTLKIVDSESGVVLPRGQRGEIAIKGPTLMLG